MFYKVPVELTTPDGGVIVTSKVLSLSKPDGKPRKRVMNEIKKTWKARKIDVVVVIHNEPRAAADCLNALRERTPKWIKWKLTVVDNGSDKFTAKMLEKYLEDGIIDDLLVMEQYEGYLPAMEVGTDETKGSWIVYVNQNVIVTDDWLEKILGAASSQKNVSMVIPWSSKRLPPPAGSNYIDMAIRVEQESRLVRHNIALPGVSCLAVERKILNNVGGWDVEKYKPGYGEVADLYMRFAIQEKRIAVRADDCYMLDESSGLSEAHEWMPQRSAGFMRFKKDWGKQAEKAYNEKAGKDSVDNLAKAILQIQTDRPKVIFIFREAPVCGLVLAATNICNQLIELGWNASFACTKMELSHWKHIPARFTPYVFKSHQDMITGLRKRLTDGFVVATTWSTAADVKAICERKKNVHPVYFVQDDERKFRYPSGELYSDVEKVEASYGMIENIVANSEWVQKELKKLGHKSTQIGIGVDTLTFRPEEKVSERIRIMAHSRPSTPRRGWPFISDIMNAIAKIPNVEFVTYDEPPEDLRFKHHGHLGRVSPRELARHMSRTHIFIEGSEMQGWGMQALEAMACGCALLCADNYGIHSFGTTGHDCIIVPHGDIKRAVAVVKRLITSKKERNQLGKNARKTALRFDWEEVGLAWDDYLKGIE